MKAAVYYKFGKPEVVNIEEISKPVPKDNEVLIENYMTSVNSGDCHLRSGDPFLARLFAGPFTPRHKVLGVTIVGKVVAIGKNVRKFAIHDEVLGSLGVGSGAHAEYVTIAEDGILVKKDKRLSNEDAATLPFGSLSALYFLNRAKLKKGQRVLIIGASGNVGSAIVQLAHLQGFHVTGLCSTGSLEFVKDLGADQVIDYKKEKIDNHKDSFDAIIDTVGNTPIKTLKKILRKDGSYVTLAMKFSVILQKFLPKSDGKKFIFDISKSTGRDMAYIQELVLNDQFKPLIEAVYAFKDIKGAHKHVEEKSKKGTVIVKIKA